jgi:hypothetical protein
LLDSNVQNGVSLSFWFKQASQDLIGAIFSFENEDDTKRMFFTSNGWLKYEGTNESYEYTDPLIPTDSIKVKEWHYISVTVTNTGYFVYLDGNLYINKKEEKGNQIFSEIVEFILSAPTLYIGYGSETQPEEMWIDDFTIYRNTNNVFEVKSEDISLNYKDKNKEVLLEIYTRAGVLIFRSPQGATHCIWDGCSLSGQPMANGIYYYVAEIVDSKVSKAGCLYLYRK